MSATFDFLRTMYQEGVSPRFLLIWTMEGESKRSRWFANIESAVQFVEGVDAHATYFGVGLSPEDFGPQARCKADQIAVLPGLVCDLDVAGPAHSKAGLPPSKDDARRILPVECPPTLTVDSGHGLYGFWLFKENWVFDKPEERERAKSLSYRWHQFLASNARRLGYVIDSVFDLSRVIRLPGTMNRKLAGDHRIVRVVEDSGRRYEPGDLENVLDTFGIPEVEVTPADADGRVAFADLRANPRVELAPQVKEKLDALLVNDSEFARVWGREKRMPVDNSWSGYAQSIANRLAYLEFANQEIIDLLAVHRREHGDAGKQGPKPLSWFTKTIGNARKWAEDQKARERKREEREAKRREAADSDAQERVLIAEVCTGKAEAQQVLRDLLELDVRRLIQVGNDVEPGYRLELVDGRRVTVPSLAAMTSFAAFNRYVWRYLGTALPAKAKRQWRAVSIALAKLIVVEDTGGGRVELMITDLGEYFAGATRSMFEAYPVEDYPDGPPDRGGRFTGWRGWLVRAESEAEYRIAVRLIALPQRDENSIPGVYYVPLKGDVARMREEVTAGRVIFRGPHLYDWLRKRKERKFEIDEMNRRLHDAGFKFRDTALECTIRLRRIWRGTLIDPAVDEHKFRRPDELIYSESRASSSKAVVQ